MRSFLQPAALLSCALLFPVAALADEPDPELQLLQGMWQIQGRTADGKAVRLLKEVDGNSETVTTFDAEGNVLHAHSADFELTKTEHIRLFTYFNYTITDGPGVGTVRRERVSYVYRVEDDRFIEVHGMLNGDRGQPRVNVYVRVKPEPQPAT
jgi:hypothetical protein